MVSLQEIETELRSNGYILFEKAVPTGIEASWIKFTDRYAILQESDMTLAAGTNESMSAEDVEAWALNLK